MCDVTYCRQCDRCGCFTSLFVKVKCYLNKIFDLIVMQNENTIIANIFFSLSIFSFNHKRLFNVQLINLDFKLRNIFVDLTEKRCLHTKVDPSNNSG